MFPKPMPISRVLNRIANADDQEVQQILMALIHWQAQHYPEDELVFFSLPKHDLPARYHSIDSMAQMLKKYVE